MLYPEDTLFLIGSILVGVAGVVCFCVDMLFGAMACTILCIAGISAHIKAKKKNRE